MKSWQSKTLGVTLAIAAGIALAQAPASPPPPALKIDGAATKSLKIDGAATTPPRLDAAGKHTDPRPSVGIAVPDKSGQRGMERSKGADERKVERR
jgi:hypothetical protein